MNSLHRHVVCLLSALALLCLSAACLAQSPFDGTWRTNLAQTKFSPKPESFYIAGGWYHCVSCDPAYTVKADGQDHAVAGQSFDTMSVKVDDPHSITVTTKKNGKIDFVQARTVSANGKILTIKTTAYPIDSSQTVTWEATARRQGPAPSDTQPTSGNWTVDKASGSANALITTFIVSNGELTMTDPTGESFTAKFDGRHYPVNGSDFYDAVSLKRINPDTIQETELRDGKIVEEDKMTVSGNTLTVQAVSEPSGRTDTYIAHKS